MARPKSLRPKSNAERQAEYRARKKAEGLKRKDEWVDPAAASRKQADNDRTKKAAAWQEELKAEELKAARKAGRQKEQAKHRRRGYVQAMIGVCDFFIRKGRPDIAGDLIKEFYITRSDCTANGFKDYDLQLLDRAGVFNKPVKPSK
jgi:hypothetical protein